ncbi:MAG: peptide chain release factor aRF-1 [Candidatus Diapherotrites archaeon]
MKETNTDTEALLFKKKVAKLKKFKGKGTELISQFIPPSADRSTVMNALTEEISQSSNIKSPQTRKNVQGALRKIINLLKQIEFKMPENGLAIFCGNVSETEGKTDIKMFTIQPAQELKVKMYWCDSEFHLDPLEEMIKPKEVYGLITIDKNEATIAELVGRKYHVLAHFNSQVPGKFRAGGQCLDPNSLIMLPEGEIIEINKAHNPLSVKSADFEKLDLIDSNITGKWTAKKTNAIKIITKNPRTELTCSEDHVLFKWNEDGKIIESPADKLNEGDFLLMPEKIEAQGKTQKLETNYFNKYKLTPKARKYFIEFRKKKKLSQKEFGKTAGIHQAVVSAIETGKFNARIDFIKNLCTKTGINFNEWISVMKPETEITLPKRLTPELAQLIGYYLGDGSSEKERISFFEADKEVIKEYENRSKKLFKAKTKLRFIETKNYFQLRVNGKAITRFISNEFPEIKKARNSGIPLKIMKSGNKVIASFLKGLFDAEGFAIERGIGLGMNNKKVIQQIQLLFLRFGIIASLHEYDNKANPYSDNARYIVDITEGKSAKLFSKFVGFNSKKKSKKLIEFIKLKKDKSNSRQMLVKGKKIKEMLKKEGIIPEKFKTANMFLNDKRMMSKQIFEKTFMKIKNKKLKKEFRKMLEFNLMPVKIMHLQKQKYGKEMIDLTIKNRNFLANGLIVHNSAKRFEHLREEAAQDFYKRMSEKINNHFMPYEDKLKGIIIGGPGMTKNYFLNKGMLDHRLKQKIIGSIDTSYTDESGVRELVQKSEDLLKDTDLMKEKILINKFFEEIGKDNLAAYGEKEIFEALAIGKVETLLVSEELNWTAFKFKCPNDGKEFIEIIKYENANAPEFKCKSCNASCELLEENEYIDFLIEKAGETGAKAKIVSTETPEGEQFLKSFGGLGAMLRYK